MRHAGTQRGTSETRIVGGQVRVCWHEAVVLARKRLLASSRRVQHEAGGGGVCLASGVGLQQAALCALSSLIGRT